MQGETSLFSYKPLSFESCDLHLLLGKHEVWLRGNEFMFLTNLNPLLGNFIPHLPQLTRPYQRRRAMITPSSTLLYRLSQHL